MRAPSSKFVGTVFALGAGCVATEAFLQPPAVGNLRQTGAGFAPAAAPVSHKSGVEVLRPSAAAAAGRTHAPGLRPSAWGGGSLGEKAGGEGTEASKTKQQQAVSGGGSGKRLARRRSPSTAAASAAAAAATAHLRQAAATTLAAVLFVASSASTEQDIMTAMMGIDPSFVAAGSGSGGAQQSVTTLSEDSQGGGGGGKPSSSMGSIDLTGQSTGAGEIPGGLGGGFKDGRLMINMDSDLATMLGKKMKTPDAEPRTH